jgi:hypothetical protein
VEPETLPLLEKPADGQPTTLTPREKKLQEATAARDAFLAARRAEASEDLQAHLSKYIKAAADLDFNAKHVALDIKAKLYQVQATRLRGVAIIWKRAIENKAADASRDAVLTPWRAFAALKPEEYAARAPEIARELASKPAEGRTPAHPVLVKRFTDTPPTKMADVVAGYAAVLAELETRWEAARAEKKSALDDAQWESLRQAIHGEKGVATIPQEGARFLLDRAQRNELTKLNNAVEQLKLAQPGDPGRGMVLNDVPKPVEPRIFIRGNPGRPGDVVPRRFLKVLSGPDRKPFEHGSGRLDLARSIADPSNPLTARVLVNRIWGWHFGVGLVTTPSDFGTRSDPPSHPELLDFLASELVRSGWSVKSIHRLILLSNAYRQTSDLRPDCLTADPLNRLVWRYNRQRLDFEATRDAILAVSGTLDPTMGGPSVPINEPPFPPKRTVYGFVDRQNLDPVYRTFDFASPDTTSPKRFVTTVPQQALFLMNSPFVQEQARRLAAGVEGPDASSDPAETVRRLYRRVLGRSPDEREVAMAATFLGRPAEPGSLRPVEQLAQVLLLTNEFLFVD